MELLPEIDTKIAAIFSNYNVLTFIVKPYMGTYFDIFWSEMYGAD